MCEEIPYMWPVTKKDVWAVLANTANRIPLQRAGPEAEKLIQVLSLNIFLSLSLSLTSSTYNLIYFDWLLMQSDINEWFDREGVTHLRADSHIAVVRKKWKVIYKMKFFGNKSFVKQ